MIDRDTTVAITPIQLNKINSLLIERKMYMEYADSLFKQNKQKEMYIQSLKTSNSLKNEKISLLTANFNACDSINKLKEQRIAILNKRVKVEQSKKVKNFFIGGGLGFVSYMVIKAILPKK